MRAVLGLLAVLALGCSSPDLGNTTFSCRSDADCGTGEVCGTVAGSSACVLASHDPITVGMSGPLQGPSQDLGNEMRRGIQAMFARVNRQGGVFGRELRLMAMNDNYDPKLALENTKLLLDIEQELPGTNQPDVRGKDSVFALLGNIGTPTMLETAPLATKNRALFFAPYTGSQRYLRDGTNSPYVYNYRAGYYQETDAMVDYLSTYRQPRVISTPPDDSYRRIIAFTQRDSYGDAGYNGLVNSYNRLAPLPQPDSSQPDPSIARLYYDREDVASVDPAITSAGKLLSQLLEQSSAQQSVAIVIVGTYQPANKFVRGVLDWVNADELRANRLDLTFLNVSFVGSNALAQALASPPETYVDVRDGRTKRSYAEGVMVTQVVPYYDTESPGVAEYRADIDAFDGRAYSFTSLEGYIAARLFSSALLLNGHAVETEALRGTLDGAVRELDIGIGTRLSFSSTNHQASQTVWGSVIQADGSFKVPITWDPAARIRPN
ncbi:MAG TPA: ABC transporter substrate-binding protein [Polyangiaceae bacterium]|nr:ABC transporter substrate-binding protein [Polyangiaceae bacterium]